MSVPPGTLIKDKTGHILHDLTETTELVFLRGGLGGKGNVFYKSSVNQAPTVAQKGLAGESLEVTLELKLLADVGIVGLPNAGKSTLISRISAAKPKIADYPFTTLVPNLGVVRFREELSFVVADIPGLIKDAHAGAGLGVQFLRHVERCRILVHLIDLASIDGGDPVSAYDEIRRELELYDKSRSQDPGFLPLGSRREIVVLNKMDCVTEEQWKSVVGRFRDRGISVKVISAATGKGTAELIDELGREMFQ